MQTVQQRMSAAKITRIGNPRKPKDLGSMDDVLVQELQWMARKAVDDQDKRDAALARKLNEVSTSLPACVCCACIRAHIPLMDTLELTHQRKHISHACKLVSCMRGARICSVST